MSKARLVRRLDTKEAREYWAFVDKVAAEVAKWPDWMKGRPPNRCHACDDQCSRCEHTCHNDESPY